MSTSINPGNQPKLPVYSAEAKFQGCRQGPAAFTPLGYVQLTSLSTATSFSSTQIPAYSSFVMLQANTQNIRWRDDGTAPTASVGMVLVAGAAPLIYSGSIAALQFIYVTSGATLEASFYA